MRAADPKLKTVRNKFIFFSLLFIILSKIGGIVRMIGYTIFPLICKERQLRFRSGLSSYRLDFCVY